MNPAHGFVHRQELVPGLVKVYSLRTGKWSFIIIVDESNQKCWIFLSLFVFMFTISGTPSLSHDIHHHSTMTFRVYHFGFTIIIPLFRVYHHLKKNTPFIFEFKAPERI